MLIWNQDISCIHETKHSKMICPLHLPVGSMQICRLVKRTNLNKCMPENYLTDWRHIIQTVGWKDAGGYKIPKESDQNCTPFLLEKEGHSSA